MGKTLLSAEVRESRYCDGVIGFEHSFDIRLYYMDEEANEDGFLTLSYQSVDLGVVNIAGVKEQRVVDEIKILHKKK